MKKVNVHKSAIVDEGAVIGENTNIWHFSHISKKSLIGDNCNIGQNVFIADNVVIGNGVKIQNNVSIYEGVTIDDNVFCGPSCVFTNILNPRSEINRNKIYTKTHVFEGASIGANSTIICGIKIGSYSLIGAGSVVTKDVNNYALVVGNPAKQIGWVDKFCNRLNLPIFGNGTAIGSDGNNYLLKNSICHMEKN